MSSFMGFLKAEGKEFELQSCTYSFSQMTDDKGRPASQVHAGLINVSFVLGDDEKIPEWMVDSDKKSSGSIVFQKIDEGSTLKEIKFEDAYCVGFTEGFTANVPDSMSVNISISARKITIGNVVHEVKW